MKKFINPKSKSYFYIFIAAALFTIGVQAFLQVVVTFSSGLGAFASLPTFVVKKETLDLRPYASLFYLALNVPLIIYYWNKNSKKFTYRTIYFLLLQAAMGSLFLIPSVNDWIQNPISLDLAGRKLRDFQWTIIVYGSIAGVFCGAGIGVSWKYGGSSGGSDIITYYWTTKRKIDVAKGMFVVAMVCLTLSFVITIVLNDNVRKYWLTTLLSSLIYLIISIRIINIIFPKYKKVSLHIVSNKTEEISKFFKESKYIHSWKLHDFEAGYSQKNRKEITTTLFRLELRDIVRKLKKIDKDVWIQVMPVIDVVGKMNSSKVDNFHI